MKTRGQTYAPGRFIPASHWRLSGQHRRSGRLEEEFYLLLLLGFEPQIAQPLHHSLYRLHRNWPFFSVSLSVLEVRTIRPYLRLDTAQEWCCYSTHANVVHYTLVMGGQPLASRCHDSTDTPISMQLSSLSHQCHTGRPGNPVASTRTSHQDNLCKVRTSC